ncbi:MAG: LPS export ABC transporter periplasmic protein LptC [Gammaproteobacteria bacterium]|jgi:LPS export ABC transporter protein LptC|nr:LPS export ABC transporter periplasmic protein LptC [Gammaproteobacteria bacterium]MBT3489398.1 LPS export ABC transporter periplasmic protein LptC [Gammaproteobacteria bacterium]MBT3718327.1 LPS export ABC transporter periplasmic protein LptC [Gammaproteobacteria bacterium]MBT3844060.1 LPS export ABC transporter periplasmic protein LptC [Gammaproteobacteria bacterium]MBT3892204.1 LPS export ABC transporter periplasmic protein LptC [Gammaproteobacteria bacterium]
MLSISTFKIHHLITLLLMIAVAVTWYLAPQPILEKKQALQETDYYIVGFDRKQMSPEGKVESIFRAERVDHFPADDKALFHQPRVVTYSTSAPPWLLRADKATRWEGNNQMELTGDVVANQREKESERFTLIETESLTLHNREELVATDHLITITTERSSSASTGARVWLKSGEIHFLKNTTSRFDP